MDEVNILTCCSVSLGARVLRVALRNIAKKRRILESTARD
mgnify:CR=1 FL=1